MTVSSFVTNLELRESTNDGSEGAGLSHTAKGLFLLHVLELAGVGEPTGSVTIVHGAGGHGGLYTKAGEYFAERGWAVALPDLRGHGASEGPRGHSWGIKEPIRDLESINDHLAYRLPDAPKIVIATGLGALYALAYALDHSDRLGALVLVSPLLVPRFPAPPKPGGLKGLFKKALPTDAAELGALADALTSDAASRAVYRGDPLVHDLVTRHVAERLPEEARSYVQRASTLNVPTLVLHGADDRLADPAASQKLAGGTIEVRSVPGRKGDLLRESDWEPRCEEIATWLATKVVR